MKRPLWWPIIIAASALLAFVVTLTGGTIRPVVVFWFLMVCPGMAFVRLLNIEGKMIELTVAIALSIAMSTLVAETMVLAGIWSYRGGLWVLIGLSMLGASFQVAAARRKTVER